MLKKVVCPTVYKMYLPKVLMNDSRMEIGTESCFMIQKSRNYRYFSKMRDFYR